MFRDIAVAIPVAVLLSLVGAVTVIPALARRLLGSPVPEEPRCAGCRRSVYWPASSVILYLILPAG
ncbi:MAG: hypothetical protein M3Z21_14655 [Pseudomonadota bacterium]|nr:hypothetical protein [Pseudomonadota bacterium]